MPEHSVVADHAGHGNHPRYTCNSCSGETLVAQPYMTSSIWEEKEKAFLAKHPTANIKYI